MVGGKEFYFWDPEFCWEILRRNPTYISAYKGFLTAVNSNKDWGSAELLRSFGGTSISMTELFYGQEMAHVKPSLQTEEYRRKTHARYIQDFSWDGWIQEQIRRHRRLVVKVRKANPKRKFDPNTEQTFRDVFNTPHLAAFLEKFGDVLHFPIPPNASPVKEKMLLRVWRLSPLLLSQQIACPSKGIIGFNVNLKFSDQAIMDALAFALKERRKNLRMDKNTLFTSKKRMKWSEFELYLKAWELNNALNDKRMGYQKIGDLLKGKQISDSASRKKWAENAINCIHKSWMPFFDR